MKKTWSIVLSLLGIGTITSAIVAPVVVLNAKENNALIRDNNIANINGLGNINNNQGFYFDNQYFSNMQQAVDYVLMQNNGVNQNLYMGSLANNYDPNTGLVNFNNNQIVSYDASKIMPAYKMADGTFTDSRVDALNSFITPFTIVPEYYNYQGQFFHSEEAAANSMKSADPLLVPYYQVKTTNSSGITNTVNINPLNPTDQAELKQIAIDQLLNSAGNQNNFGFEAIFKNENNDYTQDNAWYSGGYDDILKALTINNSSNTLDTNTNNFLYNTSSSSATGSGLLENIYNSIQSSFFTYAQSELQSSNSNYWSCNVALLPFSGNSPDNITINTNFNSSNWADWEIQNFNESGINYQKKPITFKNINFNNLKLLGHIFTNEQQFNNYFDITYTKGGSDSRAFESASTNKNFQQLFNTSFQIQYIGGTSGGFGLNNSDGLNDIFSGILKANPVGYWTIHGHDYYNLEFAVSPYVSQPSLLNLSKNYLSQINDKKSDLYIALEKNIKNSILNYITNYFNSKTFNSDFPNISYIIHNIKNLTINSPFIDNIWQYIYNEFLLETMQNIKRNLENGSNTFNLFNGINSPYIYDNAINNYTYMSDLSSNFTNLVENYFQQNLSNVTNSTYFMENFIPNWSSYNPTSNTDSLVEFVNGLNSNNPIQQLFSQAFLNSNLNASYFIGFNQNNFSQNIGYFITYNNVPLYQFDVNFDEGYNYQINQQLGKLINGLLENNISIKNKKIEFIQNNPSLYFSNISTKLLNNNPSKSNIANYVISLKQNIFGLDPKLSNQINYQSALANQVAGSAVINISQLPDTNGANTYSEAGILQALYTYNQNINNYIQNIDNTKNMNNQLYDLIASYEDKILTNNNIANIPILYNFDNDRATFSQMILGQTFNNVNNFESALSVANPPYTFTTHQSWEEFLTSNKLLQPGVVYVVYSLATGEQIELGTFLSNGHASNSMFDSWEQVEQNAYNTYLGIKHSLDYVMYEESPGNYVPILKNTFCLYNLAILGQNNWYDSYQSLIEAIKSYIEINATRTNI